MPNINKNIIMQAGAAVANATNKAAGLYASTPEPGSIISAIQLVNGGRTIGPDALAHFTESVRNKLLSLLVNMEPIQDLHGYSSPWPAGGGKNLLSQDMFIPGNRYINSGNGNPIDPVTGPVWKATDFIFIQPLAGETLTLNHRPFGNVPGIGFYDESETFISGVANNGESAGTSWTFSVPNGAYYIRLTTMQEYLPEIQLERGATATSFAPYSNICPITGRTGLDGYVGPTSAIGDATTYSMDWTTPAGTVYAGSADIVTGDIKAAPEYASYNGETLVGPWVSSMDEYDPEGTPTTGAQVVDLGGTMTEYHITGQDIITLVGDNYIWSDSGDVTITE